MSSSRVALFLALVPVAAALLGGCLGGDDGVETTSGPDPTELLQAIGTPIIQEHEHDDASLHVGAANMRLVAWAPLIPEELGTEGFAGMRVVDGYAYIATDGAHAGFLIVDVRDPANPVLVSQYVSPGGASQEAVPSWDGKWVFLNLQRSPGARIAEAPQKGTGTGIQIVNVEDKANPRFESFVPVEMLGTHTIYYYEMGGRPLVFYSGQPLGSGIPGRGVYTGPVGNHVNIAEFREVGGTWTLVPVARYKYEGSLTALTSQGCFPHDMWVEKHPLTGQELMYVAHWDCGAVLVDVTDPARPTTVAVWNDAAPSNMNRIHFFRPERETRADGRVIAFSGPEISQSPGEPGWIRAYDVTDPAGLAQIGAWRLPGKVENDMPFVFSPHNFEMRGSLLAVAHYHAGVWVLDVSDPEDMRHVAYYLPHGAEDAPYEGDVWRKTPNFPIAYFPNAYEVRWYDAPDGKTYLLATERGSGLYVFELAEGLAPLLLG